MAKLATIFLNNFFLKSFTIKKLGLIILLFSISFNIFSQTDSTKNVNQKDITDILLRVSKHLDFTETTSDSIKIKQSHFSLLPVIAYSIQTGIVGGITGNLAFVNHKDLNANVSNIMATLAYSTQQQTIAILQPNIWTNKNRFNITGNVIYLKYPQETYGLGSNTTFNDDNHIDYSFFKINLALLKQILPDFFTGIGYAIDNHWNISETGTTNGRISDFEKYGLNKQTTSSGVTINFLFDNRRSSINPQKGLYGNVVYRPNFTVFGSDQNWQSLLIDFRKYFRFPSNTNNILAFWSYNWLTLSGKPPYLDLPSTGWDAFGNTGRGYMQGRFIGLNMIDLETEYRFGILRNGLLGGVVFANAQSYSNWPQNNFNTINPGYGCGIRIKVNKQSNTNAAIDYAFGTRGSQGLFLNLCEIF